MSNLTKFFVDNPKLAIVLSLFMLFVGVTGLKNMNAESFPAVDFATAIVTTVYQGASAEDIEAKITKPIEDEIRTVTGIKDIRSVSQPGVSTIVVRVDMDRRGVDVPETMGDLEKAVDRVSTLPIDLIDKPHFLEIKSEEFAVATIAITGSNENRQRDIVADLLKDELENNKSVKRVTLDGYKERRFQIRLDPKALSRHNIGVGEVLKKIAARNINVPSGLLKSDTDQLLSRIEATVRDIKDLEGIVIRSNFSGNIIKLKDIARIEDSEEEPRLLVRYNSIPVTLLNINKKSKTDTISLVDDIEERLAEFSKAYEGKLQFNLVHNEAEKVSKRLTILSNNAITGLFIILTCLFIFLPWRIGFCAALSLPLAIMATLGVMPFFGMNLDTITILALVIVLGMLVDDSIVVSESFARRRHRGMSPRDAAVMSVKRLWMPITATAMTTIAAFLPMLMTKGIMGRFIQWIPVVVTLALVLSLIECFLFLPMRLAFFGGDVKQITEEDEETDWFHKFELSFESLTSKLIKIRYLIMIAFFAIIIFSGFMIFKANKFILFPAEQTEIYIARIKTPKGTRLERTDEIVKEISTQIKDVMGKSARHIISTTGKSDHNASEPRYSEGGDAAWIWVYADDYTKYNTPANEVVTKLQTITSPHVEELTFEAQQNGPPVGNPIEATFRSNSYQDMNQIIKLIQTDLSQVKGIYDLKTDDVIAEDEVFINLNYNNIDRLGFTVDQIGKIVRTAIAGTIISKVTLDNKDVDLFVRFKEGNRKDMADLRNVKIMAKNGNLVPLSKLAKFEKKNGSPYIKRFDYRRAKTLVGNINDDVITSMEANKHLEKSFEKYKNAFPSVSLKFGGAAESTEESMSSLVSAFKISLIGIFGLMVFLFRSYLRPFIILSTIPLGLLGFSLAFYFHQKPISFMAMIGVIGLGGVIVNSGIVLMSYIMQLIEETDKPIHEVLSYASSMRLRSVIITSLTTVAGLAPTAYGIGGKDAMLSPLTLSMVWGMTSGTILTLLWVPCAYAILEDLSNFSKKMSRKIPTHLWRNKNV
ncbi:MAG: efflux RND transporter permease subunit [Alphaproteobacteria bacterium]